MFLKTQRYAGAILPGNQPTLQSFAVTGDKFYLRPELLPAPAKLPVAEYIPLAGDHLLPQLPPSGLPVVVLYSQIGALPGVKNAYLTYLPGSSQFQAWNALLSAFANEGKLVYCLRHFAPQSNKKVELQGYGVELLLKNMEYKAVDEAAPAKNSTPAATEIVIPADEEVEGILFGKLMQLHPSLNSDLLTLRETLLSGSSADLQLESVKLWELAGATRSNAMELTNVAGVGLTATQRVIASANPLTLLRDISQNFPSLMPSLARQKVNETVREQVQALQRLMAYG